MVYIDLSQIKEDPGQVKKAIEYFQQALTILSANGHRYNEARVLCNLGNAYYLLHAIDDALKCFSPVLAFHRETGNKQGETDILCRLGMAESYRQNYDSALDYYQQAGVIYANIGAVQGKSQAAYNVADLRKKIKRHRWFWQR